MTLGKTTALAWQNKGNLDAQVFSINKRFATKLMFLRQGHYLNVASVATRDAGTIKDREHEGTLLCHVGYRETYPNCGRLTSKHANIIEDNKRINDTEKASFVSRPGDSGGAVYNPNKGGAGAVGWGIQVAVATGQDHPSFLVPLAPILSKFGVKVVGVS